MAAPSENETWVIEEGGRIIQKQARRGFESLTTWERLVYCLWVADYGMRNAGDLDAAHDLFAEFQSVAFQAAEELRLPLSSQTFSMKTNALKRAYFDRFEALCEEIRRAEPSRSRRRRST